MHDEVFAATRHGGATLNGDAISVSTQTDVAQALVATGFAYEIEQRRSQATTAARLLGRVRDIRRAGSAALDICWAACGRVDAYYEQGVKEWDIAAGRLLVAEAGGAVLDLANKGEDIELVAGPEPLISEIAAIVTEL